MYLPIFRGRQYELLALEEEVQQNLFCNALEGSQSIIPIVEPVNLTTRLTKTIESFIKQNSQIGIIFNPKRELASFRQDELFTFISAIENFHDYVIPVLYMDSSCDETFSRLAELGYSKEDCIALCLEQLQISILQEFCGKVASSFRFILVGESREFTRSIPREFGPKVICVDRFNKQARNSDYADNLDEFFSSDHRYYEVDGFDGYSDYSIIGNDFTTSGFAPRAVAIHIVYINSGAQNDLYVHHFVSDSNSDITNPAGKFQEALEKFIGWDKFNILHTRSSQCFKNLYDEGKYPGLGTIKKLSIQQHLEIVNQYFQSQRG